MLDTFKNTIKANKYILPFYPYPQHNYNAINKDVGLGLPSSCVSRMSMRFQLWGYFRFSSKCKIVTCVKFNDDEGQFFIAKIMKIILSTEAQNWTFNASFSIL